MTLSKEERETVCVYSEETNTWEIDTTVRKHITKLLKIFDETDCECEYAEDGRVIGLKVKCEYSQVGFRQKRVMTEEQRQAAAERLRKVRDGNVNPK